MGFGIFTLLEAVPDVAGCAKPVNCDTNVEGKTVLITVVGVIINEDIVILRKNFCLSGRLPPKGCDAFFIHPYSVLPLRILPLLLLQGSDDRRDVPTKSLNLCLSVTTTLINDIGHLVGLKLVANTLGFKHLVKKLAREATMLRIFGIW